MSILTTNNKLKNGLKCRNKLFTEVYDQIKHLIYASKAISYMCPHLRKSNRSIKINGPIL